MRLRISPGRPRRKGISVDDVVDGVVVGLASSGPRSLR